MKLDTKCIKEKLRTQLWEEVNSDFRDYTSFKETIKIFITASEIYRWLFTIYDESV